MKRKIVLSSLDGIIQKIQCPNPECDNILDISTEVYNSGINNIEVTCEVCGDNIRAIYKINKPAKEINTMIVSRANLVASKIGKVDVGKIDVGIKEV